MNTLAFTLTIPLDSPLNVLRVSLLMFIYTFLVELGGGGVANNDNSTGWLFAIPTALLALIVLLSFITTLLP